MLTKTGFYRYRKANINQRYGQAFCNYFGITDSDIFYIEDAGTAKEEAEKLMANWQTPE